jgi:hypothetical protein
MLYVIGFYQAMRKSIGGGDVESQYLAPLARRSRNSE